MTSTTFDALDYFERLKIAGFSEEQAKVQAAAFREYSAIQDANARQELATKMDLTQLEMRLNAKIETSKHETLKWILALLVAQTALIIAALTYVK
ncbi:MAG: hypothetical protein IJU65_05590 [Desulfovibrio sp.]|nr:hypothetical protein [Desulfovibrio sp.]